MASIYKRKADRNRRDRPWMIAYTDETGRRRTLTGSHDKDVTKEIARAREAEVCRRNHGLTTATEDRYKSEGRRPIAEHIEDYLSHCRHVRMSGNTLGLKELHITSLVDEIEASRLSDLEPNNVQRFLQGLSAAGRSARTVNHYRSDIVAFANWCVKNLRLRSNPLSAVPLLNEKEDRRRVRRALSQEELDRLLSVAAEQDEKWAKRHGPRFPAYLVAAMTGLRRNEMRELQWSDFDSETGSLRIRIEVSKAKREDLISLHTQVLEVLQALRPPDASAQDRIFPKMPTVLTFYKDLARARDKWIDEASDQGERDKREKSDFLKQCDAEGRVVDFHAMRTTLGTNLALSGVKPRLAQRIMRHSDYRTTLAHYTVLGLADIAEAINTLPTAGQQVKACKLAATGTDGRAAPGAARTPQKPAKRRAKMQRKQREQRDCLNLNPSEQVPGNASVSGEMHHAAPPRRLSE